MARRFIKDEDGGALWVPLEKRQLAFRVAQTICETLEIEAVIATVRHAESGEEGVGLYLNSGAGEIHPDTIEQARNLWRHFLR